jgi:hypothetical protein
LVDPMNYRVQTHASIGGLTYQKTYARGPRKVSGVDCEARLHFVGWSNGFACRALICLRLIQRLFEHALTVVSRESDGNPRNEALRSR